MIEIPYSLVIEATQEPDFFGFLFGFGRLFGNRPFDRRLHLQSETWDARACGFALRTGIARTPRKSQPAYRRAKCLQTGGSLTHPIHSRICSKTVTFRPGKSRMRRQSWTIVDTRRSLPSSMGVHVLVTKFPDGSAFRSRSGNWRDIDFS